MATQRFLEYSEILQSEYTKDVDAFIATDIRDVIFQSDPGIWLKNNIQDYDIVATSEGVAFRHEDWNGDNLELHLGKNLFLKLADKETLCSGIIAGKKEMLIKLFQTVYELAFFSNDPGAFVDQIFYAAAIYEVFAERTKIIPAGDNWCANLGTLKAIPESSQEWSMGSRSQHNSFERIRKVKTYNEALSCAIPTMENGRVVNEKNQPYVIVHQYDRYQPWKEELIGKDLEVFDTTIVTALYDIKRDSCAGFNRNLQQYKEWMKSMLSFNSPMVVYVDEADKPFVEEYRRTKMNITKIITSKFEDLYTNVKLGEKIRQVMLSKEFLIDQTVPTHPQISQPDYNILMHEKIQFVKRSIELNPFATDYFMWLDAGVFHMANRQDLIGQTFPTSKKYLNDKIHFIAVEPPTESDLNLEKFFKGHNVRIIGTSWLGHKDAILKFEERYSDLLSETLENNLIDQDQSYLTVTALRNPNLCSIHQGNWPDAINMWNIPVKKELVVALWDKDYSWVNDVNSDVKVTKYNKNKETLTDDHILIEPNVGRDVHTFFWHIVNRYNDLADYTFFAQDQINDHVHNYPEIINGSYNEISKYAVQQAGECWYFNSQVPYIATCDRDGAPWHPGLPLPQIWKELFNEEMPIDQISFTAAGHFCVTKEQVHLQPIEYYENVLRILAEFELAPWCIERLHPYIFNKHIN